MDKLLELPLFGPLLKLLKSRKFLVAVVSLGVSALIAQVPELASAKEALIAAVVAVASVLIGSIAHEDAAESRANTSSFVVHDFSAEESKDEGNAG